MKGLTTLKYLIMVACMTAHLQIYAQIEKHAATDSTAAVRPGVGQILFRGVMIEREGRHQSWFIPPVFELVQYNTVEGLVLNPKVSWTRLLAEGKVLALKPNLRYGFGSRRPYGQIGVLHYYSPASAGFLEFEGGHYVKQFDDQSTLTPFANSYATLLLSENFLKTYQGDFLRLRHGFKLMKHLQLENVVYWENRTALDNLAKYEEEPNDYTSNVPNNVEIGMRPFSDHQVFRQQTSLRWQRDLEYKFSRGQVVPTGRQPAVVLTYQSAFSNVLGSDVSYHNISIRFESNLSFGSIGTGRLFVEAGDFLAKDSLTLIDFNHFQGNRTTYTAYEPGTFQLLDYYTYSTSDAYFRAHYTHHFKPFNFRPGLIPVVEGNFLGTTDHTYLELGFGLQRSNMPWRISFYNSWLAGKHDRAELRVGFVLSDL